jgi:hypothetical protein
VRANTKVLADAEAAVLVVKIWLTLGAAHVEYHGVVTEYVFVVIDGVIVQ